VELFVAEKSREESPQRINDLRARHADLSAKLHCLQRPDPTEKLIEQMKQRIFDLEVQLDMNRIDTSTDPKPCPKCGSTASERFCCRCSYKID